MKPILTLALAAILCSVSAIAQDTTLTSKIDTVLQNQRTMLQMQQQILGAVEPPPPLAGKTVGIELNLARLLVSTVSDYFTLSGTFSLFSVLRSGEIAFPFFYQSGTGKRKDSFNGTQFEVPLTLLNLDVTYRHFLGKYQDGFYFSVGARYTYIKGVEGADLFVFTMNQGGPESSTQRLGAYFGIGYRYFTQSGFYWGTSLIYGRYFGGDRDYQDVLWDDGKIILDVELLKFGYAF